MATNLTNSLLRFRVTFDVANKHVSFLDGLSALYLPTYGITLANIRGKVKITSPSGTVFYNDVSPVITGVTPVWTITNIDLPLDSDDNIESGTYTFTYYLSVDGGSAYTYTTSKEFVFDYASPSVKIDLSANVAQSTLTSVDSTEYDITHETGLITPTITRTHTIMYPQGSGVSNVVSAAATVKVGPNIWSRMFTVTVSSVLSYSVEDWGAYTGWAMITDTAEGIDYLDVKPDTCSCLYYDCIGAVVTLYENNKGVSPDDERYYKSIIDELEMYWMRYSQAVTCGKDGSAYCEKIRTLLINTVPCECANDDSKSREIIPITGGGGGGTTVTGSKWTSGTGAAGLPVSPSSGDFHIFNADGGAYTTGDIYKYTGSAWVFQFNNAGADGTNGTDGADGANGVAVLINDISDDATPAGTSETDLKTYTMPVNMLIYDGDFVEIKSVFELANDEEEKTVAQYFGGDKIAEQFTDSLVSSANDIVKLTSKVNRTGSAAQFIESNVERTGSAAKLTTQTATKDLTSQVVIKATGKSGVATAGQIVCKQLLVVLNSVYQQAPVVLGGWAQGVESLTAGVTKTVTFTNPMPTTSYTIVVRAYDSGGNTYDVYIDPANKTVNGFHMMTAANTTCEWEATIK